MSGLNSLLHRDVNPYPLEFAAEELRTTPHKLLTQSIAGRRDVYAAISGSFLVHSNFDITQASTKEIGVHVGKIIRQRKGIDLFTKLSVSDLRRLNRHDRACLITVEIDKNQAISTGSYQFVDMDFEDMCWVEGKYAITVKDLYLLDMPKISFVRADSMENNDLAIKLLCELLAKAKPDLYQKKNSTMNVSEIYKAVKELAASFNIHDSLMSRPVFYRILGRSKSHL